MNENRVRRNFAGFPEGAAPRRATVVAERVECGGLTPLCTAFLPSFSVGFHRRAKSFSSTPLRDSLPGDAPWELGCNGSVRSG